MQPPKPGGLRSLPHRICTCGSAQRNVFAAGCPRRLKPGRFSAKKFQISASPLMLGGLEDRRRIAYFGAIRRTVIVKTSELPDSMSIATPRSL